MDFFNWLPQDSQKIVSPWIALYLGLATLCTLLTWQYQRYIDRVAKDDSDEIFQDIPRDKSSMV